MAAAQAPALARHRIGTVKASHLWQDHRCELDSCRGAEGRGRMWAERLCLSYQANEGVGTLEVEIANGP